MTGTEAVAAIFVPYGQGRGRGLDVTELGVHGVELDRLVALGLPVVPGLTVPVSHAASLARPEVAQAAIDLLAQVAGRRFGDVRRGEARALVGLRRGRVDLEQPHAVHPRRLTVRERVEAGAEHDGLPHAARRRLPQPFLGERAAHEHVSAQRVGALVAEQRGDSAVDARASHVSDTSALGGTSFIASLTRSPSCSSSQRLRCRPPP